LFCSSLYTKGPEAGYIKSSIEAQQNNVTIIDTSSLREPQLKGQISSGEIARAAGFYSGIHGLEKLDRKMASEIMHINDPELAHIIMEVFFEIAQKGRQSD